MERIRDATEERTDHPEHRRARVQQMPGKRTLQQEHDEHGIAAQRLARALDRAEIRAWFWAGDTRLTHYLPAAAGETPVSEETLLQRVHPDDRERLAAVWDRARIHAGHRAYDVVYRVSRGDGTFSHRHETAIPELDGAGRFLGLVGVTQDISRQMRAEEELKRNASRLDQAETEARTRDAWLRTILDNAPIEIVLKDTEGRLMAISRNVPDSYGLSQEDFIGATTLDFLPASIADIYMAADRRVVETGESVQQEVREEIDGNVRYSLSAKFPMKDATGNINGICSLTSDITELKETEARLSRAQKLEAVGKLTGGVAHDFNNLLAVIQGNAELLAAELGAEHPLTKDILRASKRGAELTGRLLAYSRQQTLQPRPTELAGMIGDMTDLLKRTLGETIEVKSAIRGDLAPVMLDPGKAEDAILNLAINARDAMPQGGTLTVECRNVELNRAYLGQGAEPVSGHYVVLAVSDTGTGMPAEVQAQAFEPFFTTKEVGKGSGLGLSMVYGFAKQSGGHFAIDSKEGRGTTVSIYFPRLEPRSGAMRDALGNENPDH